MKPMRRFAAVLAALAQDRRGECLQMLPGSPRSDARPLACGWESQRPDRYAEMHCAAFVGPSYSSRVSTTMTLSGRLSASISVSIRASGPRIAKKARGDDLARGPDRAAPPGRQHQREVGWACSCIRLIRVLRR